MSTVGIQWRGLVRGRGWRVRGASLGCQAGPQGVCIGLVSVFMDGGVCVRVWGEVVIVMTKSMLTYVLGLEYSTGFMYIQSLTLIKVP